MILDLKKLATDKVTRQMKENEEGTITQEVVAHLLLKVHRHVSDDTMKEVVTAAKDYLLTKPISKRHQWLMPYLDTPTPEAMRDKLHRLEQEVGR